MPIANQPETMASAIAPAPTKLMVWGTDSMVILVSKAPLSSSVMKLPPAMAVQNEEAAIGYAGEIQVVGHRMRDQTAKACSVSCEGRC